MKRHNNHGFTVLEVLLAGFIITVIVTGAFLVFGSLSEKINIFIADAQLRSRARLIESLMRKDIQRARPTAELEFYSERDGVPGPRFSPEPFADYGIDRTPNEAEVGFNNDLTQCDFYNPDPACDDAIVYSCNGPITCTIPSAKTENNGVFDPGEEYFDIDGNGRYTGEPYDDNARDQLGNYHAEWDSDTNPSNSNRNYRWDYDPVLQNGIFLHERWNPANHLLAGVPLNGDFDGDGAFSPKDEYFDDPTKFVPDLSPPQDNPLTMLVDESMPMVDGSTVVQQLWSKANGTSTKQMAEAYDWISHNYKLLSPFGFVDYSFNATSTTNNRYDPGEIPLYDYFGGIVNAGDQDTLYLRTKVELGGEIVPANVYYRVVFVNQNKNYSEKFTDSNNDGVWNPGEVFTDTNGNGICDPIVDPGERRLQRIVVIPAQKLVQVQDLGPTVRFNIDFYDSAEEKFVAPFSDTGEDGIYDSQEGALLQFNPNGTLVDCSACPDASGDNYFPGLAETGTENNGKLDRINSSGLPALRLNSNPFLAGTFSNPNSPVGENSLEGIKKFGYPDSAGALVVQLCHQLYPIDGREQLPILAPNEFIMMETIQTSYPYTSPIESLSPVSTRACSGRTIPALLNVGSPLGEGQLFRFAPAASFDQDGWLRCAGVRDNFAFLKPGDQIFVWAFLLPPRKAFEGTGGITVKVPVPPGYYTLLEKRGNRLRLDLSKVPGGTPSADQLRGVPAIYRAPFLPPALRIDVGLEQEGKEILGRDFRIWPMQGLRIQKAGFDSQGSSSSVPIRGTVFTVVPGTEQ